MASVQPFSYLTGEAPPRKSGFLKPEEIYGTAIPSVARSDQPGYADESAVLVRSSTNIGDSQNQLESNCFALQDPNYIRQTPDGDGQGSSGVTAYRFGQQEVGLSSAGQQLETVYGKKQPTEVHPKMTGDQQQRDHSPDTVNETRLEVSSGMKISHFGPYDSRQEVGSIEKLEEPRKVPLHGANGNLHGQVKRKRSHGGGAPSLDISSGSPSSSAFSQGSSYVNVEFHGSELSRTKSDLHDKSKQLEMWPHSSSTVPENQSIFDNNFILVKNSAKNETRAEESVKKEPAKRLKLQELFDPPPPSSPLPPPPPPSSAYHPAKVSILGVTNTESSDFQSTSSDYRKNQGVLNGRQTGPVSTFDNPDYNISSNCTGVRPVDGFTEDRSWSAWAPAGSLTPPADRAEKAEKAVVSQPRVPFPRLCAAILITAVMTGIIFFGAGFIAGWFGKPPA